MTDFEYNRYYLNKYPWKRIYYGIVKRCTNPKDKKFKYYGGKGIKCLFSIAEIQELWIRDKAWKMDKPSIDRKDHNQNYTYDNCRFIEHTENCSKEKRKPIIQCNLAGIHIKEFESIINAEKETKIPHQQIVNNLKGNQKTCRGYIWKYKEIK